MAALVALPDPSPLPLPSARGPRSLAQAVNPRCWSAEYQDRADRDTADLVSEALERTGVFTTTAITRLRTGQESGALREAALQLADYYERETSYKMKNTVELINIALSLFIMVVMTALTLVSSETAVVRPKNPMMR